MSSFKERVQINTNRIDELMNYDHTKRSDLQKLAQGNVDKFLPNDFMETWSEYVTNPRSDQKYKYKIYLPLFIEIIKENHSDEHSHSSQIDSVEIHIKDEKPPNYYEVLEPSDISGTSEGPDIYDLLILPKHEKDLIKYRLLTQYKFKIRHAILSITKDIIEDYIEDYDTLWLDVDGYALKYAVKIKYDYQKNKLHPNFTGIVIILGLCTLKEYNEIVLDSPPLPRRCILNCFRPNTD